MLIEGVLNSEAGSLDWPTRLRIGICIARGLAWLHHGCRPPFLHQDVSSNSVLLDDDIEPRVTDFGLVKLVNSNVMHDSIFISGASGEFGYAAPEYLCSMVPSPEGDVYGFGVVLMELVTRQKPLEVRNGEEEFSGNLVEWVYHLSGLGRSRDAIDKSLCGKGYDEEILQVLRIASACVVSRPDDRSSMYDAYQSLKTLGAAHGFSELVDEFALIFGKQDPDHDHQ